MKHHLYFILLLFGGCILTVGDIVMKEWVVSQNVFLFILGLLIYLLGVVFLAYSYKHENIATAEVIFSFLNIFTLLLVSWFYFDEALTTFQLIGIVLGISSVLFLEFA